MMARRSSPRQRPTGTGRVAEAPNGRRSANVRDASSGELLEHIQALRRYASALIGNPADADDLVQETLKRALVYFDQERQIDNLRAYLFTILHNVRVDALRQRARAGKSVPVEETTLVSNGAPQSESVACTQVIEAIQRLSEEHRQVLLLIGVEGLRYREAADVLGLPIGTIMSRLNRARAALREVLEPEGGAAPEDGTAERGRAAARRRDR